MDSLPPEILFQVFAKLSCHERRVTAPLVCKYWAGIVCEPSSLWHSIAVDLQHQPTVLRAPAQQWFRIRAAKLKSLQLLLPPEEAGFAADVLAALGNENSVKQLSVDFNGAEAQYVVTFLAQLAWMRQLRALRICGLQGPISSSQLLGLRHMHHLRVIDLSFADSRAPQLPEFPAVLLTLAKLEALHISSAGEYAFRILPNGMSRLQNLRELGLRRCGAHGLCAGCTGMTSLESLTVTDPSPPRHMKFPRNLAPLTCLRYVDVACREIPVPLGTVPHLKCLTLRGLRPSCRGSHDAEREFAALLEHLSLESLSLLGCRLGTVPHAVTYHCSLQSLTIRDCFLTHLSAGPYLGLLKHLDLCGNDFWKVPEEAMNAPMLQSLAMIDGVQPLVLAPGGVADDELGSASKVDCERRLQEIEDFLVNLRMQGRLCRDDDVLLHGSSMFLDK